MKTRHFVSCALGIALLVVATGPAGAVLVDNLKLHSTFDAADVTGTTSGSTVFDTSGTPVYNGTVSGTGITSGTGILNEAFDFPTASDSVSYGDVLDPLLASYTAAIWFNTDALTSSIQAFASKGSDISTEDGWLMYVGNSTGSNVNFRVKTASASAISWGSDTASVTAGSWYHAALVIDRSDNTAYAYLNGSASAFGGGNSVSLDSSTINSADNLYAGRRDSTSLSFAGLLDDFAIWDRALSAEEIAEVYEKGLLGFNVQQEVPFIPEPSTALLLAGMVVVGAARGRARRRPRAV